WVGPSSQPLGGFIPPPPYVPSLSSPSLCHSCCNPPPRTAEALPSPLTSLSISRSRPVSFISTTSSTLPTYLPFMNSRGTVASSPANSRSSRKSSPLVLPKIIGVSTYMASSVSIMEANTTLNVTESDASLNATDVETSSSLSRPRKRFSKVWLHFTEKYLEDGNKRALCNYCNASFASSNNIGTSHLSQHISQCPKRPSEKVVETRNVKFK
ncbi:hypothetical protein Taro_037607, partial [Colocasia esculenta]|nr:hypothetical protein [Colocasia esculenta]